MFMRNITQAKILSLRNIQDNVLTHTVSLNFFYYKIACKDITIGKDIPTMLTS